MPVSKTQILQEIDEALKEYDVLRGTSQHEDCSDQGEATLSRVAARIASTIDRLAPSGHHRRNLESELAYSKEAFVRLPRLAGALSALRREYELDHLHTFAELVHADTFASFIEMADHLHAQGYKDAAAVIGGSVLEQHLRELCTRNGVPVLDANGKNKKADLLNAELVGQGVYSKLDQKSVTGWLGLRNEAAHGHYTKYTADQARLMIDGITNFIVRLPA